jgi:predicted NAD/FAD-binding protein
MKIAVIGGGAAGIAAAWNLQNRAEVTIFEAANSLGGHVDTHSLLVGGRICSFDSAFTVFNPNTYPEFTRWLGERGVASQQAEASFSVRNLDTALEFGSRGLSGLFSQRRNIANWRFLEMLMQLRVLQGISHEEIDPSLTLGELIEQQGFGDALIANYLRPLCATIWSLSSARIHELPAVHVLRFMSAYQLRGANQGQWRVISGGSQRYIEAFSDQFAGKVRCASKVHSVRRQVDGVVVNLASGPEYFDALVLACHSDQALKLLEDATGSEREILGAIKFTDNRVVVHSDSAVMPRDRRAWCSWNALVDGDCQVSYWMNRLQSLNTDQQFFVTLNPTMQLRQVWSELNYRHPQFSAQARKAQARWGEINGVMNTYFCGAYWGWGSHEDAFVSGMQAAATMQQGQMRREASA